MHIYRCTLTLLERTFFSSREVGNFYQTEPLIGNYALCYALGLVNSPYFNDGTIYYREHLGHLNEAGIYVTPATLIGKNPRFVVEQFNAMTDSYWFAMANNALVTRPDGHDVEKRGTAWYLINRATGREKRVRPTNRPQIGRIKLLAIGNEAVFYLLSKGKEIQIPRYIRLGKWMSKARLDVEEVVYETILDEYVSVEMLLNPLDLSGQTNRHTFDLVSIHPAPLLRNSVLSGEFYRIPGKPKPVMLPTHMRFGIEALKNDD